MDFFNKTVLEEREVTHLAKDGSEGAMGVRHWLTLVSLYEAKLLFSLWFEIACGQSFSLYDGRLLGHLLLNVLQEFIV